MPRRATVYEVLIASPNDVSEERNLLAEVIANWNSAHSFSRGILLRSLRWELDATPAADGHPQDIINHQIVDRADLVLGVFGLRLGNPTRLAASGTAEEIERLRAAGKPVLLYFSEKMIPIQRCRPAEGAGEIQKEPAEECALLDL